MQRESFEQWLKSKGISSFGNYISRLKNVEEVEGDLDKIYDMDKCADLILKYSYSREDQANKTPLRHKIPINSQSANKTMYESYYEGSNDYKNRILKYVEFCSPLSSWCSIWYYEYIMGIPFYWRQLLLVLD
ncbi:MAG: hypothetical protein WA118_11750 [Carboxydocellales bacterium]